jgi:hypothetical protein
MPIQNRIQGILDLRHGVFRNGLGWRGILSSAASWGILVLSALVLPISPRIMDGAHPVRPVWIVATIETAFLFAVLAALAWSLGDLYPAPLFF